jgi:hypothetical protein
MSCNASNILNNVLTLFYVFFCTFDIVKNILGKQLIKVTEPIKSVDKHSNGSLRNFQ